MKQIQIAKTGYYLISAIFYSLGIINLIHPFKASLSVCNLSSIILIFYGIVKIIGYYCDDLYSLAFQYDLASGLLLIIAGIIVLIWQSSIYNYLSKGMGLLILLDSLLKIQMAQVAKKFGLETWYVILLLAIAAGIIAVLLIIEPFKQQILQQLIISLALIFEGMMNHYVIKNTVKLKHSY